MKRLLAIAVAATLLPAAAWADFQEAARAYDAGDYALAVAEWRRLALAGDVEAQAALAGMYLIGTGVSRDIAEAVRWYGRAAAQGHALAQLNLGDLYSRGRDLPRDLVEAYVWLSLAARQGREWARDRRSEIGREMTPAQRAEAERRLEAPLRTD